jgi:hypothetical protein
MRRLPHQGARHSTVDHGDASDGVFLVLQGCLGRASTSSSNCGCFLRVEWSSSWIIFSSPSFLTCGGLSGEWLSPCECWRIHVLRVASYSHSRNGGLNWRWNGPGRPAWPTGPGPFRPGSVAPSRTWVPLTFCTLPPPIASFWRCHPRVQDGGSSHMKFGLLRFNPRGCSYVTLWSSPHLGVISSCSRTRTGHLICSFELVVTPSFVSIFSCKNITLPNAHTEMNLLYH